jgi:hypothetical protein
MEHRPLQQPRVPLSGMPGGDGSLPPSATGGMIPSTDPLRTRRRDSRIIAAVVGGLRRLAVVLGTIVVLGLTVVSASRAQAVPPVLEVSNSCVVVDTPTQLTIWGSNLPAGNLIDEDGRFAQLSGLSGSFTITLSLTYVPANAGTDTITLGSFSRDILVVNPGPLTGAPGCPTTAPSSTPCLPGGKPVPVAVTGLLPLNVDLPPLTTVWYLDYPGAEAGPTAFATSNVTRIGNTFTFATSTVLPGPQATPGLHTITALSQPIRHGVLDVYTTFPISICQTQITTTTNTTVSHTNTTPTTATSTASSGTTTTASTTTTTTTTATTTTTSSSPAGPTLTVNPDVGYGGEVTQVHGSGFPHNTVVILEWLVTPELVPGIGTMPAHVGGDGTFTVGFLVFPHDQIGVRRVHVQGFPATVSAAFLDELGPEEPPAAANGQWIFRHG